MDHSGPTNQRTYLVGVYFRGQRLATGKGRSVQQAQMEAAKRALELHQGESVLCLMKVTRYPGVTYNRCFLDLACYVENWLPV